MSAAKRKTKRKTEKRPTKYSRAKIERVLERIAEGERLTPALKAEGIRAVSAFYDWLARDGELRLRHEAAREQRAEALVERIGELETELESEEVRPIGSYL